MQKDPISLPLVRYLACVAGIFASFPFIILILQLPKTPITLTGLMYLLGGVVITISLILTPLLRRRSLALATLGAALILVTVTLRIVSPPLGTHVTLITLPSQSGPRWLNRVFDEQDIVLFGARIGGHLGLVTRNESEGLVPAFIATQNKMESATRLSPFMLTYLNQQSSDAFDAIVAEPPDGAQPKLGIIFLHGYGGNFTLQCWLLAHAGERLGALTVCPSTGPLGDWWTPSGEAILKQTLIYLHGRGIQRVYLAGLSNGGIGASRLATRFESDLAGLILISGADPSAPITSLPVLVLQGEDDERIPARLSERYVTAAGATATYLPLPGDHFVMLKRAAELQDAVAGWVSEQENHQGK